MYVHSSIRMTFTYVQWILYNIIIILEVKSTYVNWPYGNTYHDVEKFENPKSYFVLMFIKEQVRYRTIYTIILCMYTLVVINYDKMIQYVEVYVNFHMIDF